MLLVTRDICRIIPFAFHNFEDILYDDTIYPQNYDDLGEYLDLRGMK
jgi:hypothetical protein